uniref:Cytosol aminopeptidase n=1 Tax=Lygus hesperus TaxID=30085 RepID=A0A0A9YDZ5_LYGHE
MAFKISRVPRIQTMCKIFTRNLITKSTHTNHAWPRDVSPNFACAGQPAEGRGLILGVYTCSDNTSEISSYITFTDARVRYNHFVCDKLIENLKGAGPFPKLGELRLFYNLEPSFPLLVVVGLGNPCYGYNRAEQRDEAKEAVRVAVGAGARLLQDLHVSKLYIESFGYTETAAEGAGLALWIYQDLKSRTKKVRVPYIGLYDDCDWTGWQIGLEKAAAQNLARQMMETPSNLLTPTGFALSAVEALTPVGVNVDVKVEDWAKENRMNAFLAVAKGSYEAPLFLDISYNGCDPCLPPVVLAGKGVTFDSGGLCLKSKEEMTHMRGDMAGAACILATIRCVASLKLPINVRGLIPLCENMPGASATRPGDIVRAMNDKSILIGNTDFEGPLIMADALSYAQKYNPKCICDVGTLTSQVEYLLGAAATGVFTNDDNLWSSIKSASIHTGDRVWRLPLWEIYQEQVTPSHVSVDLTNVPNNNHAYTAAAAAFLHNFVCYNKWMHLDTYGVMVETGQTTYMRKGMSGRPTRTLIEFLAQMACKPPEC